MKTTQYESGCGSGLCSLLMLALVMPGCGLNPFAPDPQETQAKVGSSVGWRLFFDGIERTGPAGSHMVSLGVSRDEKCASVRILQPGSVTLQVGENRATTTQTNELLKVCGRGLVR